MNCVPTPAGILVAGKGILVAGKGILVARRRCFAILKMQMTVLLSVECVMVE